MRFDEAGPGGSMRPSGLLRYAQDLAWRHSAAVGFDRDWYEANDSLWLVRSVALSIMRDVPYGETLVGVTEVTGWRRVCARRQTRFTADGGEPVATAETDWVLLTTAGRPMRIPDEVIRLLAGGDVYRPQKVDVGAVPAHTRLDSDVVRDADVDPFGHLNNAAYLDIVDAALGGMQGGGSRARLYQAQYVRPALGGSVMTIRTWPRDDGSAACQIKDENGDEVFRAVVS